MFIIQRACFFELDINIKSLVEKNKDNVTRLVVTFIFFVHKTKKRLSFQLVDKEDQKNLTK